MVVDAFEFARQQEHREGQIKLADLPRLASVNAEGANATGLLKWSLSGSAGRFGHPQLTLLVTVIVRPVCQRCLNPFDLAVASESVLVLAKDEAEADKIEEMLGDEEIDVIVGNREMNLLDLIEDEVLLALPLSPKHEICPDASKLEGLKADKPSPFAVLKDLKRRS